MRQHPMRAQRLILHVKVQRKISSVFDRDLTAYLNSRVSSRLNTHVEPLANKSVSSDGIVILNSLRIFSEDVSIAQRAGEPARRELCTRRFVL